MLPINQYYIQNNAQNIINNLYFNIENVLNVHENNVHNQCLQAFQEIFKKKHLQVEMLSDISSAEV